ncbi:MAG: hypothetical protein R3E84_16510 [Pseudomonadales bacterium]
MIPSGNPLLCCFRLLLPVLLMACSPSERERPQQAPATELTAVLADGEVSTSVDAASLDRLAASPVADGLTLHRVSDPDGNLLIVVAELARFGTHIVGVGPQRRDGVVPLDLVEIPEVSLVIGSGFVSELLALTPLGLLQIDGEMISRIQLHGYTRVLGVGESRVGIVDHLQYERGLFDSAMQVGPGVIEAGRLDISERDMERPPYFRTLVGTCGEKALFVASLSPMHLHGVGRAVLAFASAHGLACDELVNLAGDREAILGLRLADGRALFIGNPRTSRAAIVVLHSAVRDIDFLVGDEFK